jgi:hypothetical protein
VNVVRPEMAPTPCSRAAPSQVSRAMLQ